MPRAVRVGPCPEGTANELRRVGKVNNSAASVAPGGAVPGHRSPCGSAGPAVKQVDTLNLSFPPEGPRAHSLITGADDPAPHYSWSSGDTIQDPCTVTRKASFLLGTKIQNSQRAVNLPGGDAGRHGKCYENTGLKVWETNFTYVK